jgi:thiamine biosynthesis lipoprotein ApbE
MIKKIIFNTIVSFDDSLEKELDPILKKMYDWNDMYNYHNPYSYLSKVVNADNNIIQDIPNELIEIILFLQNNRRCWSKNYSIVRSKNSLFANTNLVKIEGKTLHKINPSQKIDLGSVFKGYAADYCVKSLQTENYKIDFGGQLLIRNKARLDQPIMIENSLGEIQVVADVNWENIHVATSSNQFQDHLNSNQWYSVTVIAKSGLLADALSTSIFIQEKNQTNNLERIAQINKLIIICSNRENQIVKFGGQNEEH